VPTGVSLPVTGTCHSRAMGLDYRDIAAEFARRYRLRPRAAWREAFGWSLQETADRINEFRGDIGLDPGGFAGMTASHLCEYENWPGHGTEPSGRRPTPYLLALLAAVYGCAATDLIDLADREQLPPAHLLILDKYGQGRAIGAGPVSGPESTVSAWRGDGEDRRVIAGVPAIFARRNRPIPGHNRFASTGARRLPLVPGARFEWFLDRTRGGDGRARRERARRAGRGTRYRGRHPGAAAQ